MVQEAPPVELYKAEKASTLTGSRVACDEAGKRQAITAATRSRVAQDFAILRVGCE